MKALVMNCNEFNKSLNITITINLVRTEGLTSTSQAKSMIKKVANEIENLFLDHALGIPEFNSTLECTMPKLKEDDEGSPELPIAHSLISVQCDPGYKTVSNDGCITCPRGTYWEGDNCYYCPSGSYQEFSAQTICFDCPLNKVTDGYRVVCFECIFLVTKHHFWVKTGPF